MKRIIDQSQTGVMTYHEHGDEITIAQSTDVSAALRHNERLRSAGATKTIDGDHFMASIPIDLLQSWAVKRGTSWDVVANDDKMLDRFLSEHGKCKIHQGRMA